jgi:hypothetical protein
VGPFGLCIKNKPYVEGFDEVYASGGCIPNFETELVRGLSEGIMHATSFFFRHGPPQGRSVAECGPVTSEIGGVMEMLVYMITNAGISAFFRW